MRFLYKYDKRCFSMPENKSSGKPSDKKKKNPYQFKLECNFLHDLSDLWSSIIEIINKI